MPSFLDSADARQLKQTIDWHLANIAKDAELTQRLEGVATNRAFGGMTWYWGPKLYARNRAAFRSFIQSRFSDFALIDDPRGFVRSEPIAWSGAQAQALDAWLAEVDRADDVALFRRLYAWKHRGRDGWGIDAAKWCADLSARFAAADTPARRAGVLDKFDLRAELDEARALQLYGIDRSLAAPFILKHLPHRGWRDNADKRWSSLIQRAQAAGDRDFAFTLYRRQVPLDRWRDEVLALARARQPQAELLAALDERHPEGLWSDLGPTFVALLEARGAELLPYVQKHLSKVWSSSLGRDSAIALAKLAKTRGWVDFRIAVLVKCARDKAYNDGLEETIEDKSIPEPERLRRLALFSGVSREWSFLGWGLASVQQLEPAVALKLYEHHPDLVRTQFKAHVTPAWGDDYLELFERAWAAGDAELADHLASRYVTRGMWGGDKKQVAPAERVADLLVERSLSDYLADADGAAVRDLVEGSEIHVQRLAYRVLGLRDERARRFAHGNLDILIGTLLRPLHRETRAQAFGALKNAARDADGARRVLTRAREAFALPDEGYPKEGLLDLVAHIVARHPQLTEAGETRVVYRKAA